MRLDVIFESWEIMVDVNIISGRTYSLREYLQTDLDTEEHFYQNVVSTFIAKVSSIDEARR
jgi:hypothetical protein